MIWFIRSVIMLIPTSRVGFTIPGTNVHGPAAFSLFILLINTQTTPLSMKRHMDKKIYIGLGRRLEKCEYQQTEGFKMDPPKERNF